MLKQLFKPKKAKSRRKKLNIRYIPVNQGNKTLYFLELEEEVAHAKK